MAGPRSRRQRLPGHPYPGLRPFRTEETLVFFGREGQTDELVARLRKKHFLAVLGSSGSGKSSLVFAGLLPSLGSGLMLGARPHWKMAVMRPGEHPVRNLTEALAPLVANPEDPDFQVLPPVEMLSTMLNASSFGLKEAAMGPILRENENLLVFVDQFEELFRFQEAGDPERLNEARAFVKLILEATVHGDLPVYVVITMRSDFLGECPRFRDLPEAINAGQYLVPRLTRAQMRETITGPAAVFSEALAPDLVVRMLNDIGDNPDQLPILQHALMRTWDHHTRGEEVSVADYEAIGGLQNALNQHAEEIHGELEARGLAGVTGALFKSLTETESEGKGIRRPCRLSEACAAAELEEGKVREVVEAFRAPGRSFLMPPAPTPLEGPTILDISHESFMRLWLRLGEWVGVEAASAQQYRRLSAATSDFHAGIANLWREPQLGIALRWREAEKPNAAWAARYGGDFGQSMAFLDQSLAAWNREEEERRAVADLQRKSKEQNKRNRRLLLAILGVTGLLVYAIIQGQRAERNARIARKETENATYQARLAEEANKNLEEQKREVECQLEVNRELRIQDSLNNQRIQELTNRSLSEARMTNDRIGKLLERTTQLNDTISSKAAKLADQNARLDSTATVQKKLAEEARRKTLLLEALQLAERSLESPDKDSARLMSIVAYTQYVENGGSAYDPKLYTAMMAAVVRYKSMIVQQLEFVPYAFAYNPGNEVRYYISASSRLLAEDQNSLNTEFSGKRVFGDLFLTLGQDFSSILVADLDHHLVGVDGRTLELRREFPPCRAAITAAVQTRAGDTYLSGDLAGNLVEYSAANAYAPSVRYHSTSGMIRSLALHPAGDRIAIGTRDSIIILSLRDYRKIGAIGVPSAVTAMCFNRTGNRLVFGADAGHVGFWDQVEDKVRMARFHSGRVTSVSYSPNFEYVASSSYDRTLRLWRTAYPLEPPLVLKGHLSWVTGFGFSEDSRTIYSVSRDKTMREWHTDPEALKAELEGCSDANRNQK